MTLHPGMLSPTPVVVCLMLFAAVDDARAGTVSVRTAAKEPGGYRPSWVAYSAYDGEVNDVVATRTASGGWRIEDARDVVVKAGTGCRQVSSHAATCGAWRLRV